MIIFLQTILVVVAKMVYKEQVNVDGKFDDIAEIVYGKGSYKGKGCSYAEGSCFS
jgi:hypothetical protein